jgi:hypothetical protein
MVDPHTMAETRRLMCVGVWANYRPVRHSKSRNKWQLKSGRVEDLMEVLKKYPLEATVNYEMRPNGPGTARNVQYVQVWGEGDEMGVLPAAKHKSHRNEKSITQLCGPDRNLDRVSVSHNPS